MINQTSVLNYKIISFVLQAEKVKKLIEVRDKSPIAKAMQLNCRFYKKHPKDNNKYGFVVDFLYSTKNNQYEEKDDVSVLVEVIDKSLLEFRIVNIQTY